MTSESRADLLQKKRRYWKHHVQAWQKSGLRQIEYCRRQNLVPHRFTYWKKRLEAPRSSELSFVPVPLTPVHSLHLLSQSKPLVIVADRYRIEVDGDFSSDTLTKLLHTLRGV